MKSSIDGDQRISTSEPSPQDDPASDPRAPDPRTAQEIDPASGTSDDPRVDPTPDRRQSDAVAPAGLGVSVPIAR